MFANNYLVKNERFPMIEIPPDKGCGMIVVIPCISEPNILDTLKSLNECELPEKKVEVIVLINHSEIAPNEITDNNLKTKSEIESWISLNKNRGISFFAVGPVVLKKKWAGAGLARKTGMDEAVLRFNSIHKTDGIIVSLDADTLVEKNYLVEIENHFKLNPKNVGATIAFQHQISGLGDKQLKGILLYEKFLTYYKNALTFTGFPHSIYTIGSAFAVTAMAYVKCGGMSRRQAGEDFYFLQNLIQLGTVGEINTTRVFPSARLSNRVPFGTGAAIQKWMAGTEDLTKTYNFKAFADLKIFFDNHEKLFDIEEEKYLSIISDMPESVKQFLLHDNFWNELDDLNKNCSSLKTFQARFFHKFNAFKVLKYMNFAHEHFYEKANLKEQFLFLKNLTKK